MRKIWHRLQYWFESYWTLSHWKVIKQAFLGHPFDWAYLLDLEEVKLKEMRNYFIHYGSCDHDNDIKWLNICIKLLPIMRQEEEYESHINTKNFKRFMSCPKGNWDVLEKYINKHPDELRTMKATYLYYEIRKRYTMCWWD